jgi:hypothetical protein
MSQLDPSSTPKAKQDDSLPLTAPEARYHISDLTKSYSDLHEWFAERSEDPAFKVSIEGGS